MKTPVYGIFEGGGAKGLAHVAGVAAAEKNDLEFIGVAGASAGALVASLVAVGYHAKELFDPDNPAANILERNGISPLSLIGRDKYALFNTAKKQAKRASLGVLAGGGLLAKALAPTAVKVANEIKEDGGYFSTNDIREHLNRLLRLKLLCHHADAARNIDVPERVRFKDINPATVPECCSLKVIVTDITNQRLVVFDHSEEYQEVEVAEAVSASISIPFVFKPAKIRSYSAQPDAVYADGGLVSNLPVWVFEEEKLNYERIFMQNNQVSILGFTLKEESMSNELSSPRSTAISSFDYLSGVARSAIFGGQQVATKFVPDLLPVPMPISLKTTEFDFSKKQAIDGYYGAYDAAAKILGRQKRIRPRQVKSVLEEIHNKILGLIKDSYECIDHLRVCVIGSFGDSSFRVLHSYNMEYDADDRLIFSNLAKGAPSAFKNRAPVFLDFNSMWAKGHAPANMTKYEFAQLRKTLQSAICFPIFSELEEWGKTEALSRSRPLGIVSIDSDFDLGDVFKDIDLLEKIAILTVPLSVFLLPEN